VIIAKPPKAQVDAMPVDKYFAYAAELLKVKQLSRGNCAARSNLKCPSPQGGLHERLIRVSDELARLNV
jgi:hypothetical protein